MLFFISSLILHLFDKYIKKAPITAIEDVKKRCDIEERPATVVAEPTVDSRSDDPVMYLRLMKQYARCSSVCLRVVGRDGVGMQGLASHSAAGWLQRVIENTHNRQLSIVDPKIHVDLKDWTSYIEQQNYPEITDNSCSDTIYVMLKTSSEENDFRLASPLYTKVTDHLVPLAWKPGEEFSIIGECTEEGLARLAFAFMKDKLLLDQDALAVQELSTISVKGHAVNLLRVDSATAEPFPSHKPSRSTLETSPQSAMLPQPASFKIGESEDDLSSTASIITHQKTELAPVLEMEELRQTVVESSNVKAQDGGFEGGYSLDSEGAGEALSPLTDGAGPAQLSDSFNSPSKQSQCSSEDLMNSGAGEALSPTVEDLQLLADFEPKENGAMSLEAQMKYLSNGKEPLEMVSQGKEIESDLSNKLDDATDEGLKSDPMFDKTSAKPPNVMFYSGKKDSQRRFDKVKETFSLCFNPDKYILYNLKHERIFQDPWIDNTVCLVIASDKIYDDIDKQFLRYFQNGGIILSFANNFDLKFCERYPQENFTGILKLMYKEWSALTVTCGKYTYGKGDVIESSLEGVSVTPLARDGSGNVVIVMAHDDESGGTAILSQCNLDKDPTEMAITPDVYKLLKQANAARFDVLRHLLSCAGIDSTGGQAPPLTETYLLAEKQNLKHAMIGGLKSRMDGEKLRTNNLELHFMETSANIPSQINKDKFPIITQLHTASEFKAEDYFGNLGSRVLGNTVLFTDVISSTMPLMNGLMHFMPESVGLVAIARRQNAGKGRSGNAWLSPPGCAMFSLHLRTTLDTPLGARLSYLQHIATLGVVQAVCSLPGYEDFDLRVKWPNDLYYGDSVKLGGVLVTSSIMGTAIHANIGIGVNVSNHNPTMCINDLVRLHNASCSGAQALPLLSTEQVTARTIAAIERLVSSFQAQGSHAFLKLYYQRWIHGGQSVRLESEAGPLASIVGLDDFGYLQVRLEDGSIESVHPDGNSLDMTKNLIIPKHTQH